METLVSNNKSMINLIQWSHKLQKKFNEFCCEIEGDAIKGDRIRNMRHRKHRYESIQKPVGRFILFLDAILMVAQWVVVHRAGESEELHAIDFLLNVNEETLLSIAFCADAGDEGMKMIREVDTEKHDTSRVATTLATLVAHMDYLFVQAHAPEYGYTAYLLALLERPRTVWMRGIPETRWAKTARPRRASSPDV